MRIDWYGVRIRSRELWSRVRALNPKRDAEDRRLVIRAGVLAVGVLLVPVFLGVAWSALPRTSAVERAAREAAEREQALREASARPEAIGRFAAEVLRPALAADDRFAALVVQPEAGADGALALVIRGRVRGSTALAELEQLVERTTPPAPVYLEVSLD